MLRDPKDQPWIPKRTPGTTKLPRFAGWAAEAAARPLPAPSLARLKTSLRSRTVETMAAAG